MRKITVGSELCKQPELIFEEPYQSALRNAVAQARVNLQARYHAELEGPFWDKNLPYPYVVVTAPDIAYITPGNVARHLRGVTKALISQYKEFNECREGNRLFRFQILKNREEQKKPTRHQYTVEELTDIWTEFEKEWHLMPCTHLCAEDVHKFLDFLKKKEEKDG